jgi:hypothetical protein
MIRRRQHAVGSLEEATALSRGIRDGTPRKERAEHGRPRLERVATATGRTRPQAKPARPGEESDEPIVPMKAVKAVGGKGLYSKKRPLRGRSWRLWRH